MLLFLSIHSVRGYTPSCQTTLIYSYSCIHAMNKARLPLTSWNAVQKVLHFKIRTPHQIMRISILYSKWEAPHLTSLDMAIQLIRLQLNPKCSRHKRLIDNSELSVPFYLLTLPDPSSSRPLSITSFLRFSAHPKKKVTSPLPHKFWKVRPLQAGEYFSCMSRVKNFSLTDFVVTLFLYASTKYVPDYAPYEGCQAALRQYVKEPLHQVQAI